MNLRMMLDNITTVLNKFRERGKCVRSGSRHILADFMFGKDVLKKFKLWWKK